MHSGGIEISWEYTEEYYKEYTRDTWNESADAYPTILANLAKYTPDLLAVAKPQPGERVLDVATGPGEPALTIAGLVGPEGRVTGVDLAERMLALARKRAEDAGVDNVDFHVMDAEELKFDDDTFDLVVCRSSLQIMTDPDAALAEFRRVLKPGGRVVVSVWSSPGERSPALHICVEAMLQYAEPDENGYIPTPYELGEDGVLEGMFKEAGFKDYSENAVTHDWEYDDADAYFHSVWKGTPLGHSLEEEDEDVQEKVRARAWENVKEWTRDDGRVVAPGEALIAVGVK